MQPADPWTDWIGRTESRRDSLTVGPLLSLAATLDQAPTEWPPGTCLPALWHWLYCVPRPQTSEIGPDGHARRGGFLPPVPLPRRMWAGGRFAFHTPLQVGDQIERRSVIESIEPKSGRAGDLVFVTVRQDIHRNESREPAMQEWHDIVYRSLSPGPGPSPRAAPGDASFHRDLVPDNVLLFRYSALTFNAHRIHYDRHYATAVEGYPGLVVHGPLIATLLLELQRQTQPSAAVSDFQFRALRPCFDGQRLRLCLGPGGDQSSVRLWAQDGNGALVMEATAHLT